MIEFPPLHPLLVHFSVALLPVSVACDAIGRIFNRQSLAHAAWWTLLFATVASPLTAASGWLWLFDMEGMTGTTIAVHKWLGTILPVALIGLTVWRYRFHARELTVPVTYLAGASVVLLAMIVQGHIGATMTFGSSHDHQFRTAEETPATETSMKSPDHPATTRDAEDDGWRDSIKLKEHHHE